MSSSRSRYIRQFYRMNRAIIIGNLTRDIELRFTNTGKEVANFTVAVTRTFSKDKETDFINCVAWGKTAENMAKYLSKGSKVAVEGRIQVSNYDNKEGQKVYKTEIVADSVEFLNTAKKEEEASIKEAAEVFAGATITDSEIPF